MIIVKRSLYVLSIYQVFNLLVRVAIRYLRVTGSLPRIPLGHGLAQVVIVINVFSLISAIIC
jgi:hypothetical protein